MDNFEELFEILDYLIEKYDIEEDDVQELQDVVDAITGVDEDTALVATEEDDFVDGADEEE